MTQQQHIRFTSLPNFDDVVNLKQFFLMFDGLKSIENDLTFSVFSKYQCRARCSMCYIESIWAKDFHNPSKGLPLANIFEFFNYFDTISTNDDLYFLKREHPDLYALYVDYGYVFSSCSMTDRAFVQQWALLMKELDFKDVYDIAFSEEFLATHNWRIAAWVLPRIQELRRKYVIRKVKVIVTGLTPQKESLKFLRVLKESGIAVDVYDNILLSRNIRHSEVRTPTNRFDYAGQSYPLFTENCYLQNSSLYTSLPDATIGQHSFHSLTQGFDPRDFISRMLRAKKAAYARYAHDLSAHGVSNKYVDYFNYVAHDLVVNPEFNFIPSILLSPESKFYQRLTTQGFVNTKAGLVARKALEEKHPLTVPMSLPTSRQKLSYFRIKCKKGKANASTSRI